MDDLRSLGGINGSLNGYQGSKDGAMFTIDRVRLMFALGNVKSLVVANNTLCMAFVSNRIVRIDLDRPEVVDEVELPKRSSPELGNVSDIFLDHTGSNLIITTDKGENFLLSQQNTKLKHLTPLRGIQLACIAWNPSSPSRSTGEILLGTADGSVYIAMIESSTEYFKKEVRRLKQLWTNPSGDGISGIHCYHDSSVGVYRILVSSAGKFWYWEGVSLDYGSIFENYEGFAEVFDPPREPSFAVSPSLDIWAGLTGIGIIHGTMGSSAPDIFEKANLLLYDQLEPSIGRKANKIGQVTLTEYHMLLLCKDTGDIIGVNRLNNKVVFQGSIEMEQGERILGMCADYKMGTFWVFSDMNIYEVKVGDEQRDIWRTYLANGEFELALRHASDSYARDMVSLAYGEKLLESGEYLRAAELLGKSSKPFEAAALEFIEKKDIDALQVFIAMRLKNRRNEPVQKTVLASWMLELFMEKLDRLDDLLTADSDNDGLNSKRDEVHDAYHAFVNDYKGSLDRQVAYEIISTHGRRDELLFFAHAIGDHTFVLNYWIRTEQWGEALMLLRSVNDPNLAYQYSTVLLVNSPRSTVETWMRIENLDVSKLIPSMLKYVSHYRGNIEENQVIRYLLFAIRTLKLEDVALFNTVISIYASSSHDEAPLLSFLSEARPGSYDSDFALRICTAYGRISSCVHIYSSMGQFEEAVKLALQHRNFGLAMTVADRPVDDPGLRKSLWLDIARQVVLHGESLDTKDLVKPVEKLAIDDATAKKPDMSLKGMKTALSLLKRCDLLRIDDLLPLFPDFAVIDEFRSEIITSLEQYNEQISRVNRDMEESQKSLANIQDQLKSFRKRYVLVEPGEPCALCQFPLATRKFYVFPCQHGFHFDCLIDGIHKFGDQHTKERLAHIQLTSVKKDIPPIMDNILSEKCVLCSETRVDLIDVPLGNIARDSDWDI
jgi:hypothetical protein